MKRAILITTALAMLAGQPIPAQASYWDGCGKYVEQHYKEPWASKELACERIKSCNARNKCHAQLDREAAQTSHQGLPQIFQSTYCVAQWVDLPGPRVWFTGFIKITGRDPKNPKDGGAEGPMFKVGNRLTWWGDESWSLAAAALNQLLKTCPEVEVAG